MKFNTGRRAGAAALGRAALRRTQNRPVRVSLPESRSWFPELQSAETQIRSSSEVAEGLPFPQIEGERDNTASLVGSKSGGDYGIFAEDCWRKV